MRGMPKIFCTKQDYLNIINDSEFSRYGKIKLRELADNRFIWVKTDEIYKASELDDKKRAKLDNNIDSKLFNTQGVEKEEQLTVFKKVEDKNAEIFRLGFTIKEVDELTKE